VGKRIKLFEDFVNESYLQGSRAPLYHTTGIFFSSQILSDDLLKASPTWHVVSFSRDKDFIYEDKPVTFIVDQDKLAADYKIVPFDYSHKIDTDAPRKFERPAPDFESEEVVHGDVKSLHRYLLGIRLNDTLEKYKKYKYGTKEEYREAYDDLISGLIEYVDKYGVKVTDAAGKEVTKKSLRDELVTERLAMDVEPEVETELERMFPLSDPLIKAINLVAIPAHQMAQNGESQPDKVLLHHGEKIPAKILRDAYFPGHPKFVSDAYFDAMAKHNKVYYRGVQEEKFVDDLRYDFSHFMGHSNMVQGTWITDDRGYAKDYSYNKTPLEIIIKPDAKIVPEKEIEKIRNKYQSRLNKLTDYADRELDGSRFKEVHHQAQYLKNYLLDPTIIAIALKYDGVTFGAAKPEIIVMFNREKLIIREPKHGDADNKDV
jgi:hypothetical protein